MTETMARSANGAQASGHGPLRDALGRYATGVAVVSTITDDGRPLGLTINSFSALSLEPPLILWCLQRSASRAAAFAACGFFGINVLAAGQARVAQHFATRSSGDFAGIPWYENSWGVPLLHGTVSHFSCRMASQADGGDHVIVIGQIEDFHTVADAHPLVFYRRGYHTILGIPEEPQ